MHPTIAFAAEGTYQRAVADTNRLHALRYLAFPRKNMYEPVFDVKVAVAGCRFSGEAMCVHGHRGPFVVGVVCGNSIGNPMESVGRVRAKIVFSRESKVEERELTLESSIGDSVWFDGRMRNGFSLIYYGVPLDVELNVPIRCCITVDDIDGAMSKYRPVSFYSRFALVA